MSSFFNRFTINKIDIIEKQKNPQKIDKMESLKIIASSVFMILMLGELLNSIICKNVVGNSDLGQCRQVRQSLMTIEQYICSTSLNKFNPVDYHNEFILFHFSKLLIFTVIVYLYKTTPRVFYSSFYKDSSQGREIVIENQSQSRGYQLINESTETAEQLKQMQDHQSLRLESLSKNAPQIKRFEYSIVAFNDKNEKYSETDIKSVCSPPPLIELKSGNTFFPKMSSLMNGHQQFADIVKDRNNETPSHNPNLTSSHHHQYFDNSSISRTTQNNNISNTPGGTARRRRVSLSPMVRKEQNCYQIMKRLHQERQDDFSTIHKQNQQNINKRTGDGGESQSYEPINSNCLSGSSPMTTNKNHTKQSSSALTMKLMVNKKQESTNKDYSSVTENLNTVSGDKIGNNSMDTDAMKNQFGTNSNNNLGRVDSAKTLMEAIEKRKNYIKTGNNNKIQEGINTYQMQNSLLLNSIKIAKSGPQNFKDFTTTIIPPADSQFHSLAFTTMLPNRINQITQQQLSQIHSGSVQPIYNNNTVNQFPQNSKTGNSSSLVMANGNSGPNYGTQSYENQNKKIKKLEKQLTNTKIFLNMVIHDMRNPTNSIEFAIKEILKVLKLDLDPKIKQKLANASAALSDQTPPIQVDRIMIGSTNSKRGSQTNVSRLRTSSDYRRSSHRLESRIPMGQPNFLSPHFEQRILPGRMMTLPNQPPKIQDQSPEQIIGHHQQLNINPDLHKTQGSSKINQHLEEIVESDSNPSPLNLQNPGLLRNLRSEGLQILNIKACQNKISSSLNQQLINPDSSLGQQQSNILNGSEEIKIQEIKKIDSELEENYEFDETIQEFPNEQTELLSPEHKRSVVLFSKTKTSIMTNQNDSENNLGSRIHKRKFLEQKELNIFFDDMTSIPVLQTQQDHVNCFQSQSLINQNQHEQLLTVGGDQRNSISQNADIKNLEMLINQQSKADQYRLTRQYSKSLGPAEVSNPLYQLENINSTVNQNNDGLIYSPSFQNKNDNLGQNVFIGSQQQEKVNTDNDEKLFDKDYNYILKDEDAKQSQLRSFKVNISLVQLDEKEVQPSYDQVNKSSQFEQNIVQDLVGSQELVSMPLLKKAQQRSLKDLIQGKSLIIAKQVNAPPLTQFGKSKPKPPTAPTSKSKNSQGMISPFNQSPSQISSATSFLQKASLLSNQNNHQRGLNNSSLVVPSISEARGPTFKKILSSGRRLSNSNQNGAMIFQNSGNLQQFQHLQQQMEANIISDEDKNICEQWLRNSLFSSTMLLNLINDLLDLAKIENSKFNFNTTLFNLHDVVQKALDTLDFQAQQKGIKMEYIFEHEKASHFMEISGDDNRYLQILLNFLSNALKFAPQNGSVKVETTLLDSQAKNISSSKNILPLVEVDGDSKISALISSKNKEETKNPGFQRQKTVTPTRKPSFQQNKDKNIQLSKSEELKNQYLSQCKIQTVEEFTDLNKNAQNHTSYKPSEKFIKFEIRITDTGHGISPENLSKLFMNFSKLEDHAGENKSGTGLGLSICKNLIELMGGSVNVESEVGVGTTFIMQLKTKCIIASQRNVQKWFKRYKQTRANWSVNVKQNYNLLHSKSLAFHRNNSMMNVNKYANISSKKNRTRRVSFGNKNLDMVADQFTFQGSHSRGGGFINNENQLLMTSSYIKQDNADPNNGSGMGQFLCVPSSQIVSVQKQSKNQQQSGVKDPIFSQDSMLNKMNCVTFHADSSFTSVNLAGVNMPQNFGEEQMNTDQIVQYSLNGQRTSNNLTDGMHSPFTPFVHQEEVASFKVLIANDDSFQLFVISTILRKCGFIVDQAENGLVAVQMQLELISQQENEGHPLPLGYDVIILDLDMPIMNGFEACQRLRKQQESNDLSQMFNISRKKSAPMIKLKQSMVQPEHNEDDEVQKVLIVALSGLITDSVIEKGLKCGFDDFIETPITEAKVKEVIIKKLNEQFSHEDEEDSNFSPSEQHTPQEGKLFIVNKNVGGFAEQILYQKSHTDNSCPDDESFASPLSAMNRQQQVVQLQSFPIEFADPVSFKLDGYQEESKASQHRNTSNFGKHFY